MPDKDTIFGGSLGLILENDDVRCNPRIQICHRRPKLTFRESEELIEGGKGFMRDA